VGASSSEAGGGSIAFGESTPGATTNLNELRPID
jgi:hypothetical protein